MTKTSISVIVRSPTLIVTLLMGRPSVAACISRGVSFPALNTTTIAFFDVVWNELTSYWPNPSIVIT
ncbi:MAG: hypothetical protein ACRDPC_22685 [Solirubrobacteraceae bacterium]